MKRRRPKVSVRDRLKAQARKLVAACTLEEHDSCVPRSYFDATVHELEQNLEVRRQQAIAYNDRNGQLGSEVERLMDEVIALRKEILRVSALARRRAERQRLTPKPKPKRKRR